MVKCIQTTPCISNFVCIIEDLMPLHGAAGREEDGGGEAEVADALQRVVEGRGVQPADLNKEIRCQQHSENSS